MQNRQNINKSWGKHANRLLSSDNAVARRHASRKGFDSFVGFVTKKRKNGEKQS